MLGTLDQSRREATVVGAGIAGLLAAHFLDRAGFEVTVCEKGPRAGGLISTAMKPFGIAESAAHSFLASPAVVSLCAELGVELVARRPGSGARYVVRGGRLRRMPLGPGELGVLFWRLITARGSPETRTMSDWAMRHLGVGGHDFLVSPFLTGIHAVCPDEVSLEAAFPQLVIPPGRTALGVLLARDRGPRRPMMAPRGGMGALAGALESRLRTRLKERFRCGERLERLPDAPNVIVCTPAPEAARLLQASSSSAAAALARVSYSPLVSVTVFVAREAFDKVPRGVGALAAASESPPVLGVLFNSSVFEGRVADENRHVSLTVMLGGSRAPEALGWSDADIRNVVREELARLLGLRGEPLELVIHRWPAALPRYSQELVGVWRELQETWCRRPGRVLFGNYTGDISIRGMIENAARNLGA